VRNERPRVQENLRTRLGSIHKRAPHRTPSAKKKIEPPPRPEPIRHISFDEPVPKGPSSAPLITSSYPRGRPALLPRCKSRSPQIAVVPLPPASAPIAADNSPLSSAETLAEVPQEVKRALSSRITRTLLLSRGRQLSRTSTVESNTTASPASVAEISEFGERKAITGKVEMRSGLDSKQANLTERGRFGFLKKSKTIPAERMSFHFLYSSFWPDVIQQTVPGVVADHHRCRFHHPLATLFHFHWTPAHPILYHYRHLQPPLGVHFSACLPLHPHPPSYVLRTNSIRVRRRTRGQNRSPNLLARNPMVLHTTGCHLHLGRGPWSRAQRNLRRPSDDRNVRVRLPTKPPLRLSRILNVIEREVCLFRSLLYSNHHSINGWHYSRSRRNVSPSYPHPLSCNHRFPSFILAYIYSMYLFLAPSLHPPRA
jgi:hypothetical protein